MDVRTYVEKDQDPWDLLKAGVNKRRATLLKKHIGKAGLVLDVGCAFGIYSNFLRSLGNYVVGVDASKRLVSEGKRRFGGTFALGRGESLPFKDDTFNAVLCMGTLIYSNQRGQFLSELHRTLRKGGQLCIIERNRNSPMHKIIGKLKTNENAVDNPDHYFTVSELKKLVEEAGFTVKRIKGDTISLPFFSMHKLAEIFPSLAYFLVFECKKEQQLQH